MWKPGAATEGRPYNYVGSRSSNPVRTFCFPLRATHESVRLEAFLDVVSMHLRRRLDPSLHLQHHERLRPRARRGRSARSTAAPRRESSLILRHVCGVDSAVSRDELAQAIVLSGTWQVLLPVTRRAVSEPHNGLVVHVPTVFCDRRSSDSREARV